MGVCVCMCVCAVNRNVTRAPVLEALVHTNRRAVMMSVHVLASKTVIGRRREGTSNAASSGRLEPPTISLLLVHDPGGPAWIRDAIADFRDTGISMPIQIRAVHIRLPVGTGLYAEPMTYKRARLHCKQQWIIN